MTKKTKIIATTTGAFALMALGMGVAEAAALSGDNMSVATDGAYVTNAHWGLRDGVCQYSVGSQKAWDGHVQGTFVVNTATDHLNSTVDGYGYVKIVQANSKGSYAFNRCIVARGDVIYHNSIKLQACREHWYGDDCRSVTKP